jgi:hypothetical protein
MTPCESMPEFVQDVMLAAPTTYFVMLAQAVQFRNTGFDVVGELAPPCPVLPYSPSSARLRNSNAQR